MTKLHLAIASLVLAVCLAGCAFVKSIPGVCMLPGVVCTPTPVAP